MIKRMFLAYSAVARAFHAFIAPIFTFSAILLLHVIVSAGMALDNLFFPSLRRKRVEKPIVIVGNPRSGTTFLQRYLEEKDLVPPGQLMELSYEDFVKNPVERMREAYATLGLGDFKYCEDNMNAFAARQKKFKVLEHQLPAEERKMVSAKLDLIIRHWQYPFQ